LILEEKRMLSHELKSVSRLLALACMVSIPLALCAQDAATPPAQDTSKPVAKYHAGDTASKWDIFAGYSYLHPSATITYPNPYYYNAGVRSNATPSATDPARTLSGSPDDIDLGAILSGAYFFNRYLGVQVEGAYHNYDSNDAFTTVAGGLIVRDPGAHWTPFAHVLVGGARSHGNGGYYDDFPIPIIAYFTPNTWSLDVTAGGGLDYELTHHWALRLVQADYEFMNPDFPRRYVYDDFTYKVGTVDINALRLSAGIVYHGGVGAPLPVTLACSASPDSVYPGDPVTVTAVAGNLNPHRNVIYIWSGSGVTGNGTTAAVDTALLAPGPYTVTGIVKEGKPGHEGMKPWETASCSANFVVKAFEPPTVSCSASPSTINPGDTSTVTAVGVSPQNRPLTYTYSAAAGSISGNGTTAAFNSTGAPTGPVAINCTVTDDKGQSATAPTSVTIASPVAAVPHTETLCSISFTNDKARPTRVDNEAKACLDEVALDLQKQPDAKVVVVGEASPAEMAPNKGHKHARARNLATERAVNTKAYLVTEKGIDPSRISVATSQADGQKVDQYLVPAGADFSADVQATTPVTETVVKPTAHKHAKKHAKKADQ
jgi:opacity protein-like surface antigen/outer membrane protein OmpA-like peptidoglycan-associated protein